MILAILCDINDIMTLNYKLILKLKIVNHLEYYLDILMNGIIMHWNLITINKMYNWLKSLKELKKFWLISQI